MTAATADFADVNLIGQRRARSLAGARRRSGLVRALRIALLGAMAALLLNAVLQIAMSGGGETDQPMIELTGGERIVNPRFTGRDEGGQPFVVTALSAARRAGGLGAVADLEAPSLDYALVEAGAERASKVLAATGVFDESDQSLLLREDVELTTRSGYAFSADSALIRLNEGVIFGEDGVYGEAPWGAVRAGRFEVYDEARRIVLENGVRTRLYMDDEDPGDAP
ncbi:MAG: LPS export ABC transporter periplasmic protein LptC [Oceanicaulis sp.]